MQTTMQRQPTACHSCCTVLTDDPAGLPLYSPLICPPTAQADTDGQTDARHRSQVIATDLTSNTEALHRIDIKHACSRSSSFLSLPPETQASADDFGVTA